MPMKRSFYLTEYCTAALLVGLVCAARVRADSSYSVDVRMTNVHWVPVSGTLEWQSPWELEAAASVFDSQHGFDDDYQIQFGQPAVAEATAATLFLGAGSRGEIDSVGDIVFLQSSLNATVLPGVALSAFSAATASREFTITGGTGPVDVTFSFDYLGVFQSTEAAANAGYGFDYLAGLRVSDGVNQWNLTAYDIVSGSTYDSFGGTLSDLFTLQYDTPYFLTLIKDSEIPEPSAALVSTLAAGLFALVRSRMAWRGKQLCKTKSRAGSGQNHSQIT
jgi:hypothetical protein